MDLLTTVEGLASRRKALIAMPASQSAQHEGFGLAQPIELTRESAHLPQLAGPTHKCQKTSEAKIKKEYDHDFRKAIVESDRFNRFGKSPSTIVELVSPSTVELITFGSIWYAEKTEPRCVSIPTSPGNPHPIKCMRFSWHVH